MIYIKQKGNRYYRESLRDVCSFPIKAVKAKELLRTGQAELVDHFLWERNPETEKPETSVTEQKSTTSASNVIDFTSRLKAKREQEQVNAGLEKFKTDYLPLLSKDDLNTLVSVPESLQAETLVKICMKIDLERNRG